MQAAYLGQHSDHLADILFANQKVLLPNGTAIPGPYLSGNPTLKDEIGQARLNETTGIQNYDALQISVQQRLSKRARVLVQLQLFEMSHQRDGLLRTIRRCDRQPGQRR